MDKLRYLASACERMSVTVGQVMKSRIEDGDTLVMIVDLGGKGCPKYRIPLADLDLAPGPERPPEPEPTPEIVAEECDASNIIDATPAAWALIEEHGGIALFNVIEGTGAGGRILKRDVLAAIEAASD